MSNAFGLLGSEWVIIATSLFLMIADLCLTKTTKKINLLTNIAMTAVGFSFFLQILSISHQGYAFNHTLIKDGLSTILKLLFHVGAFLTLWMSRSYTQKIQRGQTEFILLILFALIGMMFLAGANDFILFFVSLEILTVSMYVMTAYLRDKAQSVEAGIKYLILGALSTAVLLYGLSFIYGATGNTRFDLIQTKLLQMMYIPRFFVFGFILMLAALFFKIAAAPMHIWAPDVYQGAPTPVTAYLSIGSKVAGFAALARLFYTAFSPVHEIFITLIALSAGATILVGNIGAIGQTNFKRLMGYSSIGHSGYLLAAIACFFTGGDQALLYYLTSYVLSTGLVFLTFTALMPHLKSAEIEDLSGLSKTAPHMAAMILIGLLSLAGLPPLSGFFAKFFVLLSAFHQGLTLLVIVGVLNVVTSLYYYLKVVGVMYLGTPKSELAPNISLSQKIIQYACAIGILFLGIFQGPWIQYIYGALNY